jgi:photosynthetic reaction center H subunit
MLDGVGPAAYAARADTPDLTLEGEPKMVALRASAFEIEPRDPDPRGMKVIAADGRIAGVVSDVWVDRTDAMIRYFEVDAAGRPVLLPVHFARMNAPRREIHVTALYARHFAQVPVQRLSDRITMLEEDRITAFYAGGLLYADRRRAEPLL